MKDNEGLVIPIQLKSGWVKQAKSIKVCEKYKSPYYVIFNADYPLIKERVHRYPLYLVGP